jgi:hypothetical protein
MRKTKYLMIFLAWAGAAQAQVVEQQALNFGTVVLVHNDSEGSLTVDIFGNISLDNNFRIVTPGNHAIFGVSGLPANSSLPVTVSVTNPTMNPRQVFDESFVLSITSYDQQARTDEFGDATIRVGGTITTSGSSNLNFAQATYESQIRVTINF